MAIEIYKEVKGMSQTISMESFVLDFGGLEKHRVMFEKPEKQYAFIAGLLFGEMEYVQAKYHGGDFPGLSQSRNLHFTLDDLKRIAKEGFHKVHVLAYEREQIRVNLQRVKDIYSRLAKLDEAISKVWNISTEEAGFYFSLGWASAQHVFSVDVKGGKNEKGKQ
jgi:CRISPR-associated protein Cas8b/Csh1 subtype I-B